MTDEELTPRERKIARRLAARGRRGLFDCLLRLRGVRLRERFELGDLRAVGGEGAIFTVRDRGDPGSRLLGKLPVVAWDRPIRLTSAALRAARSVVEQEARVLTVAGCPYLPHCEGLQQFDNPLLESERGGEFARPDPCLVMEHIGGRDLDTWLCRVHRGGLEPMRLRATLDRVVVGVLQALTDLEKRGFLYADLRPGNLRVVGRPRRRIRLIDAGGVVPADGSSKRFPHVPSYLPPDVFREEQKGRAIQASPALHAAMAGRALFEVATGVAPQAARDADPAALDAARVSRPVAEIVEALAAGAHPSCAAGLDALAQRATRRVRGAAAVRGGGGVTPRRRGG